MGASRRAFRFDWTACRPPRPAGLGLDSQQVRARMVERLAAEGLRDTRVLDALRAVPRHLFVDSALANQAYEDTSLPIGLGQTMYWIGAAGPAKDDADGTDFHAALQGHPTITPLKVDLTDHDALRYWGQAAAQMARGGDAA